MPVDPAIPTQVPPVTPTSPAETDLDPDALEDEDFREEQRQQHLEAAREEESQRTADEPASGQMPDAEAPTPLSDDRR